MIDRTPPATSSVRAPTPAYGFFGGRGGEAWTSAGCSGGNELQHLWTRSSWRCDGGLKNNKKEIYEKLSRKKWSLRDDYGKNYFKAAKIRISYGYCIQLLRISYCKNQPLQGYCAVKNKAKRSLMHFQWQHLHTW